MSKYIISDNLEPYQKKLCKESIKILNSKHKVGLDIFTNGGKSNISAELIKYSQQCLKVENILVVSNCAVLTNLKSKYEKLGLDISKLCFVETSMLSRRYKLTGVIKDKGFEPDSIGLIVFDECHELFGDNIKQELDSNKKFIYSKYVIAMTATTMTGISAFDSIAELVGNECRVKMSLADAVKQNIIYPLDVTAVSMMTSQEYKDIYDDIKTQKSRSLRTLINHIESSLDKSELTSIENIIYCHLKEQIDLRGKNEISAKDGARVIVFFNRQSDSDTFESAITKAVQRIYSDSKVRYFKYTSDINDLDRNNIEEMLTSNKAEANTVDIIATCNIGAESFHPVNVQLGLMFGETLSLRKLLQQLGRFVSLKKYTDVNPIILKFTTNVDSRLDRYTILKGKSDVNSRFKSISRLSRFITDVDDYKEYSDVLNIKTSNIDNSILDNIDKIAAIYAINSSYTDVYDYINNNLSIIDNKYNGNIAKFLNTADKAMYNTYLNVKNKLIFYTDYVKGKPDTVNKFSEFGYRVYLGIKHDSYTENNIRDIYNSISNNSFNPMDREYKVDTGKTLPSKVPYMYAYIDGRMDSDCASLIKHSTADMYNLYDCLCKEMLEGSIESGLYLKYNVTNTDVMTGILAKMYIEAIKEFNSCRVSKKNRVAVLTLYKALELKYRDNASSVKNNKLIKVLLDMCNDGYVKGIEKYLNVVTYDVAYYVIQLLNYKLDPNVELNEYLEEWLMLHGNVEYIKKKDAELMELSLRSLVRNGMTLQNLLDDCTDRTFRDSCIKYNI